MIRDKTILDLKSKESWRVLYERYEKLPGGEYALYLCDNLPPKRTKPQRGYYYGYVLKCISEHTGYTPKEAHVILKLKYNPKEIEINGQIHIYGGSFEDESAKRVEEIYEAIRRDFAELGLDIRTPEKVTNEEYITIDQLHNLYRDEN